MEIGERRDAFTFDIDGAVIKVLNLAARAVLGSPAKYPKWSVAFKYRRRKRRRGSLTSRSTSAEPVP
jgi:NAD-dependent DNA ligase